jgi:biopolymer transport protein ExbD
MRFRRRKSQLLIEPPSAATGDIAFNLIVFFLICASTQPDSGRAQQLPKAEQKQAQKEKQDLEVNLLRDAILLDGQRVSPDQLTKALRAKFAGKTRPEERIVVLKSEKSTKYQQWITASAAIEAAGGVITVQREETRIQAAP